MEGTSQYCHLKLPDDCCDSLDLAGFFPVFNGLFEHMIGVVVISVEDALVSLGGWEKEPTGGVRVYIFLLLPERRSKNSWFVVQLARGNCIAGGGRSRLLIILVVLGF